MINVGLLQFVQTTQDKECKTLYPFYPAIPMMYLFGDHVANEHDQKFVGKTARHLSHLANFL